MAMLVKLDRLLQRVRPGGRQEERRQDLSGLTQRQRALGSSTDPALVSLAKDLLLAKSRAQRATAGLKACGRCAVAQPEHAGYQGGFCCDTQTHDVFSDGDLRALSLAGVDLGRVEPNDRPVTGCAFLNTQGCSLVPSHRPVICVAYACRGLRRELDDEGGRQEFREAVRDLDQLWERFLDAGGGESDT